MKIEIIVYPVVVAGPDRGGEDLWLDFSAVIDLTKHPELKEATADRRQFAMELNTIWHHKGEISVDFGCGDEVASSHFDTTLGGCPEVEYRTPHYGFSWKGTPEDALGLIRERLLDPRSWKVSYRIGDHPHVEFRHRHYVAGNAE
jgi:hypothetical protein